MNKLYSKLLPIILLISAISGCKIDQPVYGPNVVSTIGKKGSSSITYTVNGVTTTVKPAFFEVISASSSGTPSGSIQIGGGTDPATAFSLMAPTTVAGTFHADIITLGTSVGEGSVTFTEINTSADNSLKGTVKGTFSGTVTDFSTAAEKDVSGSFSIKM